MPLDGSISDLTPPSSYGGGSSQGTITRNNDSTNALGGMVPSSLPIAFAPLVLRMCIIHQYYISTQ